MSLALRPAAAADAGRLLDWVNRPDSLAAKLATSGVIDPAAHRAWLSGRLARPDCMIWIIERDRAAVGQVRIERKGADFEIDVYLEPAERRRSVASEAVGAALAAHAARFPGVAVLARVKPDNLASQRLFARLGFALIARAGDHLVYRHDQDVRNVAP